METGTVHFGMGTEITHRACGSHAVEALQDVQRESMRLERLLSSFLPTSDIARLNGSAGTKHEKLSPEAYQVLERSIDFSKLSKGLFDSTIGPLKDLWDYKHATEAPSDKCIRQVLPLVGYLDIALNANEKTAKLKKAGQSVDLGGIGKGFASDRFMEKFKEYGVTSAFSNIGGNVSTLGNKPDGSPWRVGIRHPRKDGLLGAVPVTGKAVVTSGDYERCFFDRKGRRYHHILNPKTGYPAESGLVSVTVVADSAMTADALSTAIFVGGLENGIVYLEEFPEIQAVLVDDKLRVYVTKGLQHNFLTSSEVKVNYIV